MTKIIQKKFQGSIPENKILDTYSESNTDTYSCNYVNQLKTYCCNYINQLTTYSTEETIIGTFMNKPLYRKMFKITEKVSSEGTYYFAHEIANVDIIFPEKAFFRHTGGAHNVYMLNMDLYESHSATDKVGLVVNDTNIIFYMQTAWGTNWEKYVILNYTKTTDQEVL